MAMKETILWIIKEPLFNTGQITKLNSNFGITMEIPCCVHIHILFPSSWSVMISLFSSKMMKGSLVGVIRTHSQLQNQKVRANP